MLQKDKALKKTNDDPQYQDVDVLTDEKKKK